MASLAKGLRDEISSFLYTNGVQEGLEAVRAHYNSHTAVVGGKELRDMVNELLDNPEALASLDSRERESIANKYAEIRIQETKLAPRSGIGVVDTTRGEEENPFELESGVFGTYFDKNRGMQVTERQIAAELRKTETGVDVYATDKSGKDVKVGELPENFLKNNPMNVASCKAQIEVEDFSNGKLKNVSQRVVVDVDAMSGDVIDLSADMLPATEKGQAASI